MSMQDNLQIAHQLLQHLGSAFAIVLTIVAGEISSFLMLEDSHAVAAAARP